jgi:hypothetical protein
MEHLPSELIDVVSAAKNPGSSKGRKKKVKIWREMEALGLEARYMVVAGMR